MTQRRSTVRKGVPKRSLESVEGTAEPIILREQAPGMIRPMWLGVAPEGGLYVELEEWPDFWSTIVRVQKKGHERVEHIGRDSVTSYLKDLLNREVIYRDWKDRKVE